MLKKYDGTNWNTASYGKVFSGTEQFTNFPLVIRSLDQSVQAYTIKGNTQTSGTPSPSNPITIEGVGEETANLFDNSFFTSTTYVTVTSITNGVNLTGTYYAEIDITLEVGTTYYLTWDENVISGNLDTLWRVQYTDDTYSPVTRSGYAMTIEKEISKVLFYVNRTNTQASVDITNIMLNTGSAALPYEPYGYKISILKGLTPLTPMYFSQQLMQIANTKDEYSSSGTATYNTYKLVLTGNETWTYQSNHSRFYTSRTDVNFTGNRLVPMLCTHYGVIDDGRGIEDIPNNSLYATGYVDEPTLLCIKTDAYSTEQTFKEYLATQYAAGTPVTIYYILKTPTTESVTAPTITTTGGEVSIDVDTTVKPSEVSLTYNGKHLNKSKKFSVGNNLIPYPYYQGDGTVAGVTWTTYSDGRIVGTGKTKDEVLFKLADSLILSSGTYTISITGTHTGMSLLVRNKDNHTQVARIQGHETSPVTFTISEEGRYEIYYNVLSYNVNVDIDCYIMLNLGSSALPYEPYGSWT